MNDQTRSDIINFLTGFLLGAFALALALSGVLGATAVTLFLIILVILFFMIKLLPQTSDPNVNRAKYAMIIGVIVGVVLLIVAPQFSPSQLTVGQILIVLGLWLFLHDVSCR